MKHTTLLLVLLFCSSFFLKAQMNTGSKFIAGYNQFGFKTYTDKAVGTSSDADKYFHLNLTTKAGYFLKNRIAIGAIIDYNHSVQNFVTSIYKNIDTEWAFGPIARYYMEYGKIIPFAEISATYGMKNSRTESLSFNNEIKHSVLSLSAGIGANYFLNEKIAIEGMLNYGMSRLKPTMKGATGEGHLESGFGCNFGLIFYFGTI